jgi:hypothetical protein
MDGQRTPGGDPAAAARGCAAGTGAATGFSVPFDASGLNREPPDRALWPVSCAIRPSSNSARRTGGDGADSDTGKTGVHSQSSLTPDFASCDCRAERPDAPRRHPNGTSARWSQTGARGRR